MKKPAGLAFLIAFTMVIPPPANAYPIPPVTLWQLIEQADVVVLARVERVEEGEKPRSHDQVEHFEDAIDYDEAVLSVRETWKGQAASEVRVSFVANIFCPARPQFEEGEVVLAFLEKGETYTRRWGQERAERKEKRLHLTPEEKEEEAAVYRANGLEPPTPEEEAKQRAEDDAYFQRYGVWATGRWFAVALSYSTLYPLEKDRPIFREFVDQAVRLQAAGKVDPADRREWLISAAERRATRWQGLYELAPKADTFHFFYDSDRQNLQEPLSGPELSRLAAGFVSDPSVDSTLLMLLTVLAPIPDADVDRTAAAAIEAALERRPQAWWLPDAMARTFERFGDPDPERRLRREKVDCDGVPICTRAPYENLPEIWRQARLDLGIPEVAPADVPERLVAGVGGETPD